MQICKILDSIENLIDMFLRLNVLTPFFQTIRQTPPQKLEKNRASTS